MTRMRVLLPFAAGYFLSYLYRVVNAVIAPELVRELGLDPGHLGLLTAAYFLTFAACQLPLGILLDRYEPRRVEAALLLCAAAGALVFSRATTAAGLLVGRALIGVGVSACLMAAFRAFVQWFPRQRLPLVNGVQMAAGGLGAVTATAPVELALHVTDWRGVFLGLSGATVVVAGLVRFAVPERRIDGGGGSLSLQLRGLREVFRSAVFWRVAPWAVASQAAFLAVQGLWAGPWLRDVAGLERAAAAHVLLLLAAAMVAGFLSLGTLAERLSGFGFGPLRVAAAGMGVFLCLQAGLALGVPLAPGPLWALFGFFGTSGILTYAALTQSFPEQLAGRVNTALNLLVFVAAFAAQWGVGAVIGRWAQTAGGTYPPAAYRAAFGALVALQALAALWFGVHGRRRRDPPGDPGA